MTDQRPSSELLNEERARASEDLHAALDALAAERALRKHAEARLRDIESSRTWRWGVALRRITGRERRGSR